MLERSNRRLLASALHWVATCESPWLAELISRLRPDLQKRFRLDRGNPVDRVRFLSWLVSSGRREYRALDEDQEFAAFLGRCHPDTGLTMLQLLVYADRADVQAAYPLSAPAEIAGWFERHAESEYQLEPLLGPRRTSVRPATPLPFGVNLIGYAFGQLGIGEDLRMAARALQSACVPFTVIDFPPGANIPQNDRSMSPYISTEAPYLTNIFCMTALEHGRFHAERGQRLTSGRYNIGYWPWELGRWPEEWRDLTRLVDEVWVSSTHTFDSLASVSPVPVLLMPMAVELGKVAKRSRAHFGLPEGSRLFCFAFDLNSSMQRKNPQACIYAFLEAFPKPRRGQVGPEVGLVIKAHAPKVPNIAWSELKAIAAKDPRIHIIEETLPRAELLALYKCCDCFVSLHRAEGFGRNLAEALALGLHIITTGYSGNTDFCHPPHADLVNYRLVKLRKGQYPFADGQAWAEPDVKHAAELMRAFAERPRRRRRPALDKTYSLQEVGATYRTRLMMIDRRSPTALRRSA